MSQSTSQWAETVSQLVLDTDLAYAVSALAVWEYLITFTNEVNIFWRKPMNATSLLFVVTRWTMAINALLDLAPTINETTNCEAITWVINVLYYAGYIVTAVFSTIRLFAIWQRSYLWACIVLLLGLAPVVTNLYIDVHYNYRIFLWPGPAICVTSGNPLSSQDMSILPCRKVETIYTDLSVVYVTRGSLVAADSIVLILTWIKTFKNWNKARRLKVELTISACLLRDGTWYFIALLALNTAQMLTYNNGSLSQAGVLLSPIVTTMPPVLMNRFIINLKSLSTTSSSQRSSARDWSQFSALNFRTPDSFLGNIGEDLQDGHEPADDDLDSDQEMGTASLSVQGSLERELHETARPGSPGDVKVSGSELPASEAGSSCLPSEAYTLPGSEEIEDGRLSSIIHIDMI